MRNPGWEYPGSLRIHSLRIQWIIISFLILGQCAIAGRIVKCWVRGILIDHRDGISLKRFQRVAWLIVLFERHFVECFANVAAGNLFSSMEPQLLSLRIVSKMITDVERQLPVASPEQAVQPMSRGDALARAGAMKVNSEVKEASWSLGEEVKVIITVLLVVAYVGWPRDDLTSQKTFNAMSQVNGNGIFIGSANAAYLACKSSPTIRAKENAQIGCA
jgi:hypothetical protein